MRFSHQLMLLSILISILLGANASTMAAKPETGLQKGCIREVRNSLGIANENAVIAASDYRQVNTRNLAGISDQVGNDLRGTLWSLPVGSHIFDSGGGFSVYGLELAEKGYRVTTVNTQNFYQDALFQLMSTESARAYINHLRASDARFEVVQGGVTNRGLVNIAGALKVSIPASFQVKDGLLHIVHGVSEEAAIFDLTKMVADIQRELVTREQNGNFVRVTDFAQNLLRRTAADSQDEVIDSFGAYYYSSDRIQLLEQYFRVLKPAAKGHLVTAWPYDEVIVAGKRVDLIDFLEKTFPQNFKVENTGRGLRTIIITKTTPCTCRTLENDNFLKMPTLILE